MKRILFLVVTLCLVLSSRMLADLGNSESQIANLYGKPVKQGFPDPNGITTNMYQKGDYMIVVQFLREYSLAESYARLDKRDFSDKELSAFLEASSNGRQWNKDPNKLAWERSDHKAKAWSENVSGRPTLLIEAQ
jgi:hypothetical protein